MTRTLTAPLALTLVAIAAPAAPVPKDAEKTVYFPTKVGAKWVYKYSDAGSVTQVVTAVEDKDGAKLVVVGDVEDGKVQHRMTVKVADDGLYVVGTGVLDLTPSVCFLKLPHKDGGRWEAKVTARDKKSGSEGTMRYKYVASGPEEVKVPAGTFMAVRVDEVDEQSINRDSTTWYAPGVGMVKTSRVGRLVIDMPPRRMETVLMSFTTGKE